MILNEWYKSKLKESKNYMLVLPRKPHCISDKGEINYSIYGVHSFLPMFCSIEEWDDLMDEPITSDHAKRIYENINNQIKEYKKGKDVVNKD